MSLFLRYFIITILFFNVHLLHAKSQTQAITTIALYTQCTPTPSRSCPVAPQISNYEDAGVSKVGTHNIDGINSKIREYTYDQRDSTIEIQNIVDKYNQMIAAFLTIITNTILNSNQRVTVQTPTLTIVPSAETADNYITVEVNGKAGNSVFVNSIEKGVLDDNGTVTITITLNHGENELRIMVKDTNGNESDPLILNIVSNVPPLANNDNVTISEDIGLDVNVTINDSDSDGDIIHVTSVTATLHGTTSLNTNGTIKYIPNPNYFGTDSFDYNLSDSYGGVDTATMTITINSVNDAPLGVEDNSTTNEDTMVSIAVLANDNDVENDTLSVTNLTNPSHGSVTLNGVNVEYTPNANYFGPDSFTYTPNDGTENGNLVTVNISVLEVLNLPILANQVTQTYVLGTPITSLVFNNTGDAVATCSVSPSLPVGLALSPNNDTCEITGTPTLPSTEQTYTITGTNTTGSDHATVDITITPDLLINEISSAYYTNDDRWFEIYNPTAAAINIMNYTLKSRSYDGSSSDIFEFTLPSKIISSGGYLIVRPNYGPAFTTTLPDVENDKVMYLKDTASNKYPIWFSDEGGFLELLKNEITIDFVTIGDDYSPTTANAWTGTHVPTFTTDGSEFWKSIARDINSSDTNNATDWVVREFPTYAGLNDVTCNDDVDADGIPDCSEVSGSTYAGMDLYEFGTRTNQKDVFIEVDYMDSTNAGSLPLDEGVVPRQEALAKVKDAFATNGFTVHFDVGDLFAQNGATIAPSQMDLGGGNEVPYASSVTLGSGAAVNARDYKADNMQTQRKQIFHYMLFGTSQNTDGSAGSSGLAEKPGNDSIITLGGWELNSNTVTHTNRLINYQAGTVMHEFGHNLGLGHGGNESKNYKPNYLSVMNYLYQLSGLPTIGDNEGDRYYANKGGSCPNSGLTNPSSGDPRNFQLDYSHGTGSDLDEINGIDEANGLGRVASVPVDYNCNNIVGDVLTNFNANPSWDAVNDTLTDYNDWVAVNIVFARTTSGNNGVSLSPTMSKPILPNPIFNDIQPVAEEYPINIPQ